MESITIARTDQALVQPNDESISQTPRFTLFENLPKEIRLIIWKEAMPGPRLVLIEQRLLKMTIGDWEDNHGGEAWPPYGPERAEEVIWARDWVRYAIPPSKDGYRVFNIMGIARQTPTPNVFLACKESYSLAMETYACTFACNNSIPETYFNFEDDTLCLEFHNLYDYWWPGNDAEEDLQLEGWNNFRKEDIELVQKVNRLAVRVQNMDGSTYRWFDASTIARILRVFKGVTELSFVLRSTRNDHFDERSSNLALMDAIEDVDKATSVYANYAYWLKNKDWSAARSSGDVAMPVVNRIRSPIFSTDGLKEHQERDNCWAIPVIKEAIFVDRKSKKQYEEAKQACEEAVDELIERIDNRNREQAISDSKKG